MSPQMMNVKCRFIKSGFLRMRGTKKPRTKSMRWPKPVMNMNVVHTTSRPRESRGFAMVTEEVESDMTGSASGRARAQADEEERESVGVRTSTRKQRAAVLRPLFLRKRSTTVPGAPAPLDRGREQHGMAPKNAQTAGTERWRPCHGYPDRVGKSDRWRPGLAWEYFGIRRLMAHKQFKRVDTKMKATTTHSLRFSFHIILLRAHHLVKAVVNEVAKLISAPPSCRRCRTSRVGSSRW
jgi:hypothetical protein